MNGMRAQLIKIILEANSQAAVDDERNYDRPLRELGIDSLDVMAVLLAIQEQYGVGISDEDLDRLKTVNAMTAYLESLSLNNAT